MGPQLYTQQSNRFYGEPITQGKPRELYAWIHENSGKFSIALHVRREGYYNWHHRPSKETRDTELVLALEKVRKTHPCYGVQSMIDELLEGEKVSYGKGYRVCRDNGLLTKSGLQTLKKWPVGMGSYIYVQY